MQYVLGPQDDDAYESIRAELLGRFAQWMASRRLGDEASPADLGDRTLDDAAFVDPHDAGLLLDFRWGYDDGNLVTWTTAALERLFPWLDATLVLTDEQDALRVVGATREFLRFLADGGLLGPASDEPGDLIAMVGRYSPRLRDLPRRAIPCPDIVRRVAVAAPIVASFATLRRHAEAAAGLPLDAHGSIDATLARALAIELGVGDPAEHRQLDDLVEWAKRSGALRTYRGALVATKGWAALARDPVHLLDRVADGLWCWGPLLLQRRITTRDRAPLEVCLDRYLVTMLALAYADDEHVAFDEFVDRGAHHLRRAVALAESFRSASALESEVRRSLGNAFDYLRQLAIVDWHDTSIAVDERGRATPTGGTITLTAYGVHWCQRHLVEHGFDTPVYVPFEATAADPDDAIIASLGGQLALVDANAGPDVRSLLDAFRSLGDTRWQRAFVERAWRCENSSTVVVLDAIGTSLHDMQTAKAARKAALRLRTRALSAPVRGR